MRGSALRSVVRGEAPSVPEERGGTVVRGGEAGRGGTIPAVFDRMERMMDEMFRGELWGRFGAPWDRFMREVGFGGEGGIKLDMFEEGGALVVKAELPGVVREDLNVRVVEGNLLISGERRHEEKVERKEYLRVERNIGAFSRSIPLPEGVNTEEITATLKEGILEVRIPRTEAKKPVLHIEIA
jgi:HSP20 family protein